jgi:cytoskeletal protein CcmA (bactofilin family)
LFGRDRRPEPDAIEAIIGPRASFSGHLKCDASIRIDGAVEGGDIETPANVILTETARAECNISAKTVSIRGFYRGTIDANRVELLAGSQVYGVLNVRSFFMDDSVSLQAELNIRGSGQQERLALPQPNATGASIPIIGRPKNRPSATPVASRESPKPAERSMGGTAGDISSEQPHETQNDPDAEQEAEG